MLRQILNALRKTDVLGEMFTQLGRMLQAGAWMFDKAAEVLMHKVDWKTAADELYARDKQINQIEQKVREGILTHLSLGNQADLSACLVLMSVVKDAERIGDYCKNIFEVGRFYEREYVHPQYARPLADIRGCVAPLFAQTEKAFLAADRDLARRVMDSAGSVGKTCDLLVRQLLSTGQQMSPDEAVAYVLAARFFKRVAAHLANIASSVISPVPLIDFRAGKNIPTD